MSSPDAQPPLTRRQARERERAAQDGARPVVPGDDEASTPASAASTASVPASAPDLDPVARRRPGSHAAPVAPREAAAPAQAGSAASSPALPPATQALPLPASATEIVPGTGGLTRRQLRALRAAQDEAVQPVPLQAPTPQSSDRTVADVIGSVQEIEDQKHSESKAGAPASVPSEAALSSEAAAPSGSGAAASPASGAPASPGATASPNSPREESDRQPDADAPEEPDEAPYETVPQSVIAEVAAQLPDEDPANTADLSRATVADWAPDGAEPLAEAAAESDEPVRHRSTWASSTGEDSAEAAAAPDSDERSSSKGRPELALPEGVLNPTTPEVFPLDLDDEESSETSPSLALPSVGTEAQAEPKPITTAYEPPSGHWSVQGENEVHDEETGIRRIASANTNAIVMPNSALGDVTGALNATGEVILTGSIDLPKSLSSTGSHRPIDGAEVDRLLDQQEEISTSDATPVRASKAISSHTSTRAVVLAATKPKESRTPTVLAVSAASVGVAAVAALVFAGFALHWV